MKSFIEIIEFVLKTKKIYLLPLVIIMIFLSLIISALSVVYLAPFIYSIF